MTRLSSLTALLRSRRFRPALAVAGALVLTLVLASVLASGAEESPSRFQLFVGRLHPLVVHLPIGFLLLALLLEGASWTRSLRRLRPAVPFALVLGALSAVAAVLAGYLLGATGGYGGPTLLWHKRLGIGVAVASVSAVALWYALRLRPSPSLRMAYTGSLLASAGLLTAAGHLGGSLSHGPEFVTEYMPAPMRAAARFLPGEAPAAPAFARLDEAEIYRHLVQPVLQARCVSCHGPDQQKGELRLDSPEAILKGGDSGPAAVAGQSAESEMIRRIWLPEGHEDAMPPRGRKPLTVLEAELIRWWIDEGASPTKTVTETTPPPGIQALLEQLAGPPEERVPPVLRTPVAAADPAALANARRAGVALRPLAAGSNFLRAQCTGSPESCGAEQLQALLPLAPQIASLHLGGAAVGDREMEAVGRFPHLIRLHLERTRVTDVGLAHLRGLQHLEYLNLYGTSVSDAGLEHLAGLGKLRSLYLWQTAATPAGSERLRQRLGRLRVDHGLSAAKIDTLLAAADSVKKGRAEAGD